MARRRLNVLQAEVFPAYTVWELTLACDHGCAHCGSRAGKAREEGELSTEEALRVVSDLAKLGTREVVLIGGEAYLHPGFLQIIAALRAQGVKASLTTGGRGITEALAHDMAKAGLHLASVSIDGLEESHNQIRASRHSFAHALAAIDKMRAAGIATGANTNLNRINQEDLEELYDLLRDRGISVWQVQLTAPLGRAADRPNMLLQPWMLRDLMPRIAALKEQAYRDGILMLPGNNLGYFGPDEALLRSPRQDARDHFSGCQAGRFVMGIESQGAVKACPSLQKNYVAGNLRSESLSKLWKKKSPMAFARQRSTQELWGYCGECVFAETCKGGCTFTAHAFFGRPGNNPYCHHRALQLAKRGRRERLVLVEEAEGRPFDNGRYEIIEEPMDSDEPMEPASTQTLVQIARRR